MSRVADILLFRNWWVYDPGEHWYNQPYHWLNLIEGTIWIAIAGLVLRRYRQHRHSPVEIAYAAAFFTFGLSDFHEAWTLPSWLILFKGVNLIVILWLRNRLLNRYYPDRRMF